MKAGVRQSSCPQLLRSVINVVGHAVPRASPRPSRCPRLLCPPAAGAVIAVSPTHDCLSSARQTRRLHTKESSATATAAATATTSHRSTPDRPPTTQKLPVQCPGCGGLTQLSAPDLPGYFNLDRRAVRSYLGLLNEEPWRPTGDDGLEEALKQHGHLLKDLSLAPDVLLPSRRPPADRQRQDGHSLPLCDRCHNLTHHHAGNPIFHPTVEAVRETIQESAYKYNHVYHALDAADFPMSLLPNVHQLLDLMPLRTRNRRSKPGKFSKGKWIEMSFIITRSDLLAPKKEQVDRLMPTLVDILRRALPRASRRVRLGNVSCVSAKRSWWTSGLKEDIWKRGGAGWLVGKVNVGKSQLFEAVFPKGRMDWEGSKHNISVAVQAQAQAAWSAPVLSQAAKDTISRAVLPDLDELDEESLLPPPREEANYPQMPIVSALPGTTASPIRVPFGGGKGELIDLPGLARSGLEKWVREELRPSLVMKSRVAVEQHVIKPGQSLLIGGLIRITPRTADLIFLAYAFTPIAAHLTATERAIAIQTQQAGIRTENIAIPGIGEKIRHAGSFKLEWDSTKKRTGPLTRKDAVGLKVDRLPYRVVSLDILIEGCGWVEISAQVRTKHLFPTAPQSAQPSERRPLSANKSIWVGGEEILQELDLCGDEPGPEGEESRRKKSGTAEPNWPVVDVYSPEGRFIGSRQCINAWLYNQARKTAETSRKRPRRSMTGAKKRGQKMERKSHGAGRHRG